MCGKIINLSGMTTKDKFKISMKKNYLIEFFHNNFVNYMSCRLKKRHTYDIMDM